MPKDEERFSNERHTNTTHHERTCSRQRQTAAIAISPANFYFGALIGEGLYGEKVRTTSRPHIFLVQAMSMPCRARIVRDVQATFFVVSSNGTWYLCLRENDKVVRRVPQVDSKVNIEQLTI